MTATPAIVGRLSAVRKTKTGWSSRCPAHEDRDASLSISVGEDGRVLVHCFAGCHTEDVVRAVGLEMRDLAPQNGQHGRQHTGNGRTKPRRKTVADAQQHADSDQKTATKSRRELGEIERAYSYRDERGNLVFQVCRFEGKDFRQRRRKTGGGWEWTVKGSRVILYRLPELLAEPDRIVFVVEGEKDVDNLRKVGLVVTCNAGGAGKWIREHAEFLRGRLVVILPDNDQAGRDHAKIVAETLRGVAAGVKILELPGLPEKGDVSDWLSNGGTVEDLRQLVQEAPSAEEWIAAATPTAASGDAGPVQDQDQDDQPEQPEFEPFPSEALPEPIRSYVVKGAAALGCDESFVAVPILATLAAAVSNSRSVRLKSSWTEPAVVWSLTIGPSGCLKSPSWELAVRPLQEIQTEFFRQYEAAQDDYQRELLLYEQDLAAWKKSGRKAEPSDEKKDPPRKKKQAPLIDGAEAEPEKRNEHPAERKKDPPPDRPQEPVCVRYLAADATVEACCRLLSENPRGILLARDELSGWLNGFDAYKSARGADVAHWLSFHRAGTVVIDRKSGRQLQHIPRAAVSVAGTIQPETLRLALGGRYEDQENTGEHFSNGLAARMLMAMPPIKAKRWTDEDLDPRLVAAVDELFARLLSLEPDRDQDGKVKPVALPLTRDAQRRFVSFYNQHATETVSLSPDLAAAWSKLEGYAARLALILHLVRIAAGDDTADPAAVDLSSLDAGITLSRWFGNEATRIYATIGGTTDSTEARETRERDRLVEWIRTRGGSCTARELQRSSRRYATADEAETALQALVNAGLGRWHVSQPTEGPGRPACRFLLTPVDTNSENAGKERIVSASALSTLSENENSEWETVIL